MASGSADEAVVVVKRRAEEDVVTHPRVKLAARGREAKGEGPNVLRSYQTDGYYQSKTRRKRS
jgi:hypothetical protein